MFLRIISYITQRAIWSWEGFSHVLTTERSIYQWVFANVVSMIAAFSLPLSVAERSLIIMGGIMIIAMECMNTAIERVVDDISEEKEIVQNKRRILQVLLLPYLLLQLVSHGS